MQKQPKKPAQKKAVSKYHHSTNMCSLRCPYAKRCGGCTWINLPYDEQISRKEQIVKECIGAYAKPEPMIRMKNPDHYRNKVTAVFAPDRRGSTWSVCGIYERNSHAVVPVEKCLLENPTADRIIQSIRGLLPSFKIRPYDEDRGGGLLRYVQIRTARATHEVCVTLVCVSPVLPAKNRFVEALRRLHPEITTILLNVNDRTDSMILGDREIVLYGPGYITDKLCGKIFRISSRSFYQVNPIQTAKLYNIAIDDAGLSGKETILDAYCGIGTIGICAADRAAKVIGVELNPEAVKNAIANAALNFGVSSGTVPGAGEDVSIGEGGAASARAAVSSKGTEPSVPDKFCYICQDAGEYMKEAAERGDRIDVLFMDPPRAGASEDFLAAALALAPKKIVYISCNPETLGRDLAILTKDGAYTVKKATPVDMFPATNHVETVCLLSNLAKKPDSHVKMSIDLEKEYYPLKDKK